ncbi:hypothetical protein TNCV_2736771 [Trichonephila clavipes]|nr:hypothetical protein TNCV_2736771 [Trichonephila clavipes]
MRPLEDASKNGWTGGRFQRHDGSKRPMATEDQEHILIVRSAIIAFDSSLSTIRWNVDDLDRQLEQIWQEIPQETIRVINHSISCRVVACIHARGVSTPY